jgi:hypothetical protein
MVAQNLMRRNPLLLRLVQAPLVRLALVRPAQQGMALAYRSRAIRIRAQLASVPNREQQIKDRTIK